MEAPCKLIRSPPPGLTSSLDQRRENASISSTVTQSPAINWVGAAPPIIMRKRLFWKSIITITRVYVSLIRTPHVQFDFALIPWYCGCNDPLSMSIIWVKETDQPSHNTENTWRPDASLICHNVSPMVRRLNNLHFTSSACFKMTLCIVLWQLVTDVTSHVSRDTVSAQQDAHLPQRRRRAILGAIRREILPEDNRR